MRRPNETSSRKSESTASETSKIYESNWPFPRYRVRKEMFAWMLHRISGLGLVLYLILHVWGLKSLSDPEAFNQFIAHYHSPLVKLLEFFLLGAAVYHGLNGLRITLIDFLGWSPHQNKLYWTLGAIAIVLFAVGGYPSLYALYTHYFG